MAGPTTLFQSGTTSSRPAASAGCVIYWSTDDEVFYLSDGSSWTELADLSSLTGGSQRRGPVGDRPIGGAPNLTRRGLGHATNALTPPCVIPADCTITGIRTNRWGFQRQHIVACTTRPPTGLRRLGRSPVLQPAHNPLASPRRSPAPLGATTWRSRPAAPVAAFAVNQQVSSGVCGPFPASTNSAHPCPDPATITPANVDLELPVDSGARIGWATVG